MNCVESQSVTNFEAGSVTLYLVLYRNEINRSNKALAIITFRLSFIYSFLSWEVTYTSYMYGMQTYYSTLCTRRRDNMFVGKIHDIHHKGTEFFQVNKILLPSQTLGVVFHSPESVRGSPSCRRNISGKNKWSESKTVWSFLPMG